MNFLKKYWILILIVTVIISAMSIVLLFLTLMYLCASQDKLTNAHWLAFLGSFLSFLGSLFLGIVALKQNKKSNKINAEMRIINEKMLNISQQVLDNELYSKVPILKAEIQTIDGSESLYKECKLDLRETHGSTKLLSLHDNSLKKYHQLGHFILNLSLLNQERIENFRVKEAYIHYLGKINFIYLDLNYFTEIQLNPLENTCSICVKICGDTTSELKDILKDNAQINLTFNFRNSLNRELEYKCCFILFNKKVNILNQETPKYTGNDLYVDDKYKI